LHQTVTGAANSRSTPAYDVADTQDGASAWFAKGVPTYFV